MGNETSSAQNSADVTPNSDFVDYMSNYSMGSRRWSSASASSMQNSPVTPPEPDLSHLTQEERAQIAAVIARAKALEREEDERIRDLENDYSTLTHQIDKRSSMSDISSKGDIVCPVCNENELKPGIDGGKANVCADCERTVCRDCGTYQTNIQTKLQEWLCIMCHKRRHLVMSSGLWYHGFRQRPYFEALETLAVYNKMAKHNLQDCSKTLKSNMEAFFQNTDTFRNLKRPPLERTTSLSHYEDFKATEERRQIKSSLHRQGSLPSSLDDTDQLCMVDNQSLEQLRQSTSSQRSLAGSDSRSSTTDERMSLNGESNGKERKSRRDTVDGKGNSKRSKSYGGERDLDAKKQQHRPQSLSLTRQHSSEELSPEQPPPLPKPRSQRNAERSHRPRDQKVPDVREEPEWRTTRVERERVHGDERDRVKQNERMNAENDRRREWDGQRGSGHSEERGREDRREQGRRDQAAAMDPRHPPGKDAKDQKRDSGKDSNSKESKNNMNNNSRQVKVIVPSDEDRTLPFDDDEEEEGLKLTPRPSPVSPKEGEYTVTTMHDMSTAFVSKPVPSMVNVMQPERQYLGMDDTADANSLNVAAYAASISLNTAQLTNLSVSPTEFLLYPSSQHDHRMEITPSPESSQDSLEEVSPYYDELEDVELADPADKNVDYQGTRRQKAMCKPPATDWSPVIDLSPIQDVSPSIEEAEQEDMLVAQIEEQELQEQLESDLQPLSTLKRYRNFEDISQLQERIREYEEVEHLDLAAVETLTARVEKECKLLEEEERLRLKQSRNKTSKSAEAIFESTPKHEIWEKSEEKEKEKPTQPKVLQKSASVDMTDESKEDEKQPPRPASADPEKPRKIHRTLPQPTPEMLSSAISSARSTSTALFRQFQSYLNRDQKKEEVKVEAKETKEQKDVEKVDAKEKQVVEEKVQATEAMELRSKPVPAPRDRAQPTIQITDTASGGKDPGKLTRDAKSRPSPLHLQQFDAQEDNASPHYRVMRSPITPESAQKIKREYPDYQRSRNHQDEDDAFFYPSPVTPPDNQSPPKPQSPSMADELDPRSASIGGSRSRGGTPAHSTPSTPGSSRGTDSPNSTGEKKIRRKLPPIPAGVAPATAKCTKEKSKPVPNSRDKSPMITASNGGMRVERVTERRMPAKPVQEETKKSRPVPPPKPDTRLRRDTAMVQERKTESQVIKTDSQVTKERPNSAPSGGRQKPQVPPKPKKPSGVVKPQVPQKSTSSKPQVPPKPTRGIVRKEKQDDVDIFGVKVPKKLKNERDLMRDELILVTYSRKRQIEELEEIRILEKQLDEIRLLEEKQRDSLQEKLRRHKEQMEQMQLQAARQMEQQAAEAAARRKAAAAAASATLPPGTAVATVRMSPQASPRRGRHKRQNSDPIMSKFSPIEEYRDMENEFQSRTAEEAYELRKQLEMQLEMLQRGISVTNVTRPVPARRAQSANRGRYIPKPMMASRLSKSTEFIGADIYSDMQVLSSSQSEKSLLTAIEANSPSSFSEKLQDSGYDKSPTRFSDDGYVDQMRRNQLEAELLRAKRAYEFTASLSGEDVQRYPEAAELWRLEDEEIRRRYYEPSPSRSPYPMQSSNERLPPGIIKPIEDTDFRSRRDRFLQTSDPSQSAFMPVTKSSKHEIYSSSEYIAHKEVNSAYAMGFEQFYADPRDLSPNAAFNISRDSGISSSAILADAQNQKEIEQTNAAECYSSDFSPIPTEPEGSPQTEPTPAMPLLGDVKRKSRLMVHEISRSRPTSGDYDNYYFDEDGFHELHRAESDQSFGDSDEPIMDHMTEGGVTILKRKPVAKVQPAQKKPQRYKFPYKRILLTRDPKDRSVKGNGLGMKIVGGKYIPGTNNEIGAFVAAVYPEGVVDQLHGELQEGDQILEWNGIELTGRTYEEVQQIISQPNGEIELVVKPSSMNLSHSNSKASTTSTLKSESCHSLYDNIEFTSDTDEYDSFVGSQQGVDPNILAAQLEGIKERMSPGLSPTVHHQDPPPKQVSPKVPRSTTVTTTTNSTTHENHLTKTISPPKPVDKYVGEIQLQLDYDDYDESFTVHVIKARDLVSREEGAILNPYVKMFLLPGRGSDNRRKTKYIPDTNTPEWHHTLVFMTQPRKELKKRNLEVTVWNFNRTNPHEHLGEVSLDLSDDKRMDNKPYWYRLKELVEKPSSDYSLSMSDSPSKHSDGSRKASQDHLNKKSPTPRSNSAPPQERDPSPRPAKNRMNAAAMNKVDRLSPKPRRKYEADVSSQPNSNGTDEPTLYSNCNLPRSTSDVNSVGLELVSSGSQSSISRSTTSQPPDFTDLSTSTSTTSFERLCSVQNNYHIPVQKSRSSGYISLDLPEDILSQTTPYDIQPLKDRVGPGQLLLSDIIEQYSCGIEVDEIFDKAVTGEVLIHIRKDLSINTLSLTVVQCRNIELSQKLKETIQGVYTKVYLMCSEDRRIKSKKRKTKVKKFCLEPFFQEHFLYNGLTNGQLIQISVWTEGKLFSGNKNIGETLIYLDDVHDPDNTETYDIIDTTSWYKLMAPTDQSKLSVQGSFEV